MTETGPSADLKPEPRNKSFRPSDLQTSIMKTLLLLVALMFCCCISRLDALSGLGCRCIRTVPNPVPARAVKKIEVIPVSGRCRRTEILITKRNGSIVCVPPKAKWFPELLETLQRTRCDRKRARSCVDSRLMP
uniref:Chemokine interleukin-8-like domain-containing protein n=2 Tax=Amphiprion ocellaris TaxID=80972 RepID=A0AAQ5XYX2_AMPOC